MSQEALKRRLKVLMNRSENQVCSDCPERQPRWASLIVPPPGSAPGSLKIGAFCCLECSGSHRRLGTHISFVRSITLDTWKENEVLAMENGGNSKVNAIFEPRLSNPGMKPPIHSDGRTRERFIRDKYERRKYYDSSVLHEYANKQKDEEESQESEEEQKISRKKKGRIAPIRAPSDAAKKRAESRRSRLSLTRSPASRTRKQEKNGNKKAITVAQVTTSPEIDLLDFNIDTTDQSEVPNNVVKTKDEPVLDLFGSMNIVGNSGQSAAEQTSLFPDTSVTSPPQKVEEAPQQPQKKKFNNDEILSMFNAPQQGYSNTVGGMTNMMNNSMVTGIPVQNRMGMVQPNMQTMMMPQSIMQPNNMMGSSGANTMMQQNSLMRQQNPNVVTMSQQRPTPGWIDPQQTNGISNASAVNHHHIAMMNQMQMGNSAMMMMASGSTNDRKQTQQQVNMYHQRQQNQTNSFNGFGF